MKMQGLLGGSDGKESAYSEGDLGSMPGLGRCPGGGYGNPLQYYRLENTHGQRSLAGCSSWGRRESDMTEQLSPCGCKENACLPLLFGECPCGICMPMGNSKK